MKRSKFGNKRCKCDGFNFASKLERDFYLACKAWKAEGKIYDFKMQVPFTLHGAHGVAICKYKLDFEITFKNPPVLAALSGIEFAKNYVEVKGYWTAVAKIKKKLFEAEYGKLEIHSQAAPWKL